MIAPRAPLVPWLRSRTGLVLLAFPSILTLAMFPILVTMYVRLARREEQEILAEFGEEYARYATATPAFFPRPRRAAARKT